MHKPLETYELLNLPHSAERPSPFHYHEKSFKYHQNDLLKHHKNTQVSTVPTTINSKICYTPNNTKNGKEQRKGKYYITNSSIISQIKTTGGRGSTHSFMTLQRIKPLENLAQQGNIVT